MSPRNKSYLALFVASLVFLAIGTMLVILFTEFNLVKPIRNSDEFLYGGYIYFLTLVLSIYAAYFVYQFVVMGDIKLAISSITDEGIRALFAIFVFVFVVSVFERVTFHSARPLWEWTDWIALAIAASAFWWFVANGKTKEGNTPLQKDFDDSNSDKSCRCSEWNGEIIEAEKFGLETQVILDLSHDFYAFATCEHCGQRYLYEWHEHTDWVRGDDSSFKHHRKITQLQYELITTNIASGVTMYDLQAAIDRIT